MPPTYCQHMISTKVNQCVELFLDHIHNSISSQSQTGFSDENLYNSANDLSNLKTLIVRDNALDEVSLDKLCFVLNKISVFGEDGKASRKTIEQEMKRQYNLCNDNLSLNSKEASWSKSHHW